MSTPSTALRRESKNGLLLFHSSSLNFSFTLPLFQRAPFTFYGRAPSSDRKAWLVCRITKKVGRDIPQFRGKPVKKGRCRPSSLSPTWLHFPLVCSVVKHARVCNRYTSRRTVPALHQTAHPACTHVWRDGFRYYIYCAHPSPPAPPVSWPGGTPFYHMATVKHVCRKCTRLSKRGRGILQ
ncbi:unnamed protein product [Chondrus crispus]|uniref:Uncharacterized protein n=1 Tax=Chondrus crispus TaxID=2769 RepID=R7QQV7_CHOCR|nr:unnamed protein product [Chondrus crispus]CDF39775.1 unnamed protein product [Chondrus crispus]|eukprot:XP_005710069.1 unnamed protein product [Chondrus crispus]